MVDSLVLFEAQPHLLPTHSNSSLNPQRRKHLVMLLSFIIDGFKFIRGLDYSNAAYYSNPQFLNISSRLAIYSVETKDF